MHDDICSEISAVLNFSFCPQFSSLCPNLFPFALILPSEIDYFYRDIYLLVHDDNDIDNDDDDDFEW